MQAEGRGAHLVQVDEGGLLTCRLKGEGQGWFRLMRGGGC